MDRFRSASNYWRTTDWFVWFHRFLLSTVALAFVTRSCKIDRLNGHLNVSRSWNMLSSPYYSEPQPRGIVLDCSNIMPILSYYWTGSRLSCIDRTVDRHASAPCIVCLQSSGTRTIRCYWCATATTTSLWRTTSFGWPCPSYLSVKHPDDTSCLSLVSSTIPQSPNDSSVNCFRTEFLFWQSPSVAICSTIAETENAFQVCLATTQSQRTND